VTGTWQAPGCSHRMLVASTARQMRGQAYGKEDEEGRKANKTNLSGIDFEALVKLRKQVEDRLHQHRTFLERQLANWDGSIASLAGARENERSKNRPEIQKLRG
jgi:hypothetical protein